MSTAATYQTPRTERSRPHLVRSPADARVLGTVLGVWAHPDDEAYLSANLMTLAVEAGSRVVCVTATRGENGTDQPRLWPAPRLARLRSEELDVSLATLGVTDHRWLSYRDGACDQVPPGRASAELIEIIDEVRPDTVVTFGPDGFTGHPDHVAVSRWVSRAVSRAHHRVARLWWAAAPASWAARHEDLHERLGVFDANGPTVIPDEALAATVEPDDVYLDRKMAALRAQRSQTRVLIDAVGEVAYRRWWSREHFVSGALDWSGS